jgi:peptidyl-tRNA hydrolase
LSRFNAAERKQLGTYIDVATEALEMLLREGAQQAMNSYNNREILT